MRGGESSPFPQARARQLWAQPHSQHSGPRRNLAECGWFEVILNQDLAPGEGEGGEGGGGAVTLSEEPVLGGPGRQMLRWVASTCLWDALPREDLQGGDLWR